MNITRTPYLSPRVIRIDGREMEVMVPSFSPAAQVELSGATTDYEWTKPHGVQTVYLTVYGAGGAGGNGNAPGVAGGGGGSGMVFFK